MKKLLLFATALFAVSSLFAQNSIPNPSFENWSAAPYMNPLGYQSSNNSNNSNGQPPNVFRITDAYHGSYAVQMKSVKFGVDTAAAYVAIGNPGGSGQTGGTPISGTPLGMRLYYKYTVKAADSAVVIVEFKKSGSFVGQYIYTIYDTTSKYILFSQVFSPALSAAPDTVIFAAATSTRVLNSNNGGSSDWAPGTVFQIDSVTFTGIASQPPKINGDFENWISDTNFTLVGWNNWQGSDSGNATRTTDAENGKYAVQLVTGPCGGCGGGGANAQAITSGTNTQCCGPKGGLPYTLTKDTLEFYYKYAPSAGNINDTAMISINLHNPSNNQSFNIYLKAAAGYTKVDYPFTVAGFTPDSVHIDIQSSWSTKCCGLPVMDIGSTLKVDNMKFLSQLPITVTPANPSYCTGGSAVLTASGATTYTWSPSTNLSATTGATVTANPFLTTTYTVTGTSGSQVGSQKITVVVNSPPTVTITPSAPSICNGSSVSLKASGAAVSYTWSPNTALNTVTGSTVIANPATTITYTVDGTSAAGCVGVNNVTVTVNPVPLVSVTPSAPVVCSGSGTNITASGASFFTWSPATGLSASTGANVTANPAATTTYTVIGKNASGCADTIKVTVTVDNPLVVKTTSTNITCNGACNGSAVPTVTGGTLPYSFSWSNGMSTTTASPLCPNSYTLTVTDALGCAGFSTANITQPSVLTVNTATVNTSCGQSNGQGITTVGGGTAPYTYSWNSVPVQTSPNATALPAGTYTVTVTDANNCTAMGTVVVGASSAPGISVKVTPSNCGTVSGVATATVTGGTAPYKYSWNNGKTKATVDSLAAGVYIITVTDADGCSSFEAVTVSDTNGPSINVSTVTQNKCYGQSIGAAGVTVTGGTTPYKYSWSNGATTTSVSSLQAGPYQITVTDAGGCTDVKTVNITAPTAITLATSTTQAGCSLSDGGASVTASGGTTPYTYVWSTSVTSTSVSNVAAGTYSVLVTDKNGCKDSANASVSNAAGPVVTVTSVINDNCTTGSAGSIGISDSGGTAPYTYMWSNGFTTSTIGGLTAGNYNVIVTDAGGCKGTANATITEVQPPAISICMVTVDPKTNHNTIIWDKSATPKIASYNIYKETTSPGLYGKIGSVKVDSSCIYIDSLSNALVRSWRYEISQVDSCGNESPLSQPHKTMHLTINQGLGGAINLIWDNYQGLAFGYYIVYRDSIVGQAADSINYVTNSGIFTFTDYPWTLSHAWYYHMGISNPGGCNPQIEAVNYNASKSNTGNFSVTGIPEIDAEINSFDVFPNPNTGMFNLNISLARQSQNVEIKVLNTMGQVLWIERCANASGNLKKQIDLSAYSKGVYLVQVTTGNSVMYRKVIVQ